MDDMGGDIIGGQVLGIPVLLGGVAAISLAVHLSMLPVGPNAASMASAPFAGMKSASVATTTGQDIASPEGRIATLSAPRMMGTAPSQ